MRKGREESNRALKHVFSILAHPKENDGDSQVVKKPKRKGRWNHSEQKKQEQQQSWGPCFNRLANRWELQKVG